MTNGDKVREMNNSELAEIIACPYGVGEALCNEKNGLLDLLPGMARKRV